MKSSTQTLVSLNRQNKMNNEIKRQKELGEIKKLDKEINKQIKNKTNHFKKTKRTFGGNNSTMKRVTKSLPDGETYVTYEMVHKDKSKNSPSIVNIFNSSSSSTESQLVNGHIDTGFNNENAFGRQSPLPSQQKPVISTSFVKSRKKRRFRPLKNINNIMGKFIGTRKNK